MQELTETKLLKSKSLFVPVFPHTHKSILEQSNVPKMESQMFDLLTTRSVF